MNMLLMYVPREPIDLACSLSLLQHPTSCTEHVLKDSWWPFNPRLLAGHVDSELCKGPGFCTYFQAISLMKDV